MKQFWQAEIDDPTNLQGASVASILAHVAAAIGSDEVTVSSIEGAGESLPELMKIADAAQTIRIQRLRAILEGITQLDWGNFTFIRGASDQCLNDVPYIEIVRSSLALVRAVDSSYLYVYGQDSDVLDRLRRDYPTAVVKVLPLQELEFPE
jgi:hypothetical protein